MSHIHAIPSSVMPMCPDPVGLYWVAVKERKLSYHHPETVCFAMCPCYANFKLKSFTGTQLGCCLGIECRIPQYGHIENSVCFGLCYNLV